MKILKGIFLVIILLIVSALIVALFVKKDMGATREVVITKPKTEVFEYVKYLKNQNNFSKWAGMDPNMKKDFKGTDATVGFVSAWESNVKDVGKGEQEITAIKDGESINYEIRFIKPFESKATSMLTTEAVNDSTTKVKWSFAGRMNYPLNIMQLFMDMDKSIGDDFGIGLNNLKAILEKK